MDYNRSNPNGFVSTKTLVGLATAGILSFAWWAIPDDSMVDGEIQPLYEKVIKGEFKLEFTNPEKSRVLKTLKSTVK